MPTANPLLDGFNDSPSSVNSSSNVDNYLEFLNKAEGSPKSNTIVGGGKFDDYSKHPNIVGVKSSCVILYLGLTSFLEFFLYI